jgi:hypothetical protein
VDKKPPLLMRRLEPFYPLVIVNKTNAVVPKSTTPMWRNGRRYGLKIEVFASSLLFVAYQFNGGFPGKLREFVI